MRFATVNGKPSRPTMSGLQGTCILCGSAATAKVGPSITPHWAHLPGQEAAQGCELYLSDESGDTVNQWHTDWQDRWPDEWQEVVIERGGVKHIADVLIPGADGGLVIEFQHSHISPEAMAAREEFYPRMIWVFDATGRGEVDFVPDQYRRHAPDYQELTWTNPWPVASRARKGSYLHFGGRMMFHPDWFTREYTPFNRDTFAQSSATVNGWLLTVSDFAASHQGKVDEEMQTL